MTRITDMRGDWLHRSKVKVIRFGRQSDTCLLVTRQRKVVEMPTLTGRLSLSRLAFRTSSKVKVTRPLNAVTENHPHLRNGRHTNFKLGIRMEYDDPHHRHARMATWGWHMGPISGLCLQGWNKHWPLHYGLWNYWIHLRLVFWFYSVLSVNFRGVIKRYYRMSAYPWLHFYYYFYLLFGLSG